LEIAVVLVGTDRLNASIRTDEQVMFRFLAADRFGRLEGMVQFRRFLGNTGSPNQTIFDNGPVT